MMDNIACSICLDSSRRKLIIKTNCNHNFHKKCITENCQYLINNNKNINYLTCPICRTILDKNFLCKLSLKTKKDTNTIKKSTGQYNNHIANIIIYFAIIYFTFTVCIKYYNSIFVYLKYTDDLKSDYNIIKEIIYYNKIFIFIKTTNYLFNIYTRFIINHFSRLLYNHNLQLIILIMMSFSIIYISIINHIYKENNSRGITYFIS